MPDSEACDRGAVHPDGQRERQDLLSLTPTDLRDRIGHLVDSGHEPPYRIDQVTGWVYGGEARSIAEMTNIPRKLRTELDRHFTLDEPELARLSRSADGTAKHLWRLHDGELIESVLIPTGDRLTLCLSSQAGCAMGCTFCATGWAGFARHLTAGEIVAQFRASRRWATAEGYPAISNVVYMGMGEPLANREPVMASLVILNQGYGVGARRITVSTVGLVPGILDLAKRPEQFGLAVSLHAPNSELRRELIPLEKRYPLPELLAALGVFHAAGGKRITFEYTMIKNVNDDPALGVRLATIAVGLRAFVNLIPFNPIPHSSWEPSSPERIRAFRKVLAGRGVSCAVREPRGRDIDAACGQLRARALSARALPVRQGEDQERCKHRSG